MTFREQSDEPADAEAARRSRLTGPLTIYATLLAAFWMLICVRGYRAPRAGEIRQALGLEWRLGLPDDIHLLLFAALGVSLVIAWLAALKRVRHSSATIGHVVVCGALLALPMVTLTGIYSDDVYLYHLYGRELVWHGANPIVTPPAAFPDDPHLKWVYWQWLPSAYGPVWLGLSAALSAVAGESITAAVILYRLAGLTAHLATAWIIWRALRSTGERRAIAAAACFAWNPFVLFESVASAHNDAVMVACICAAAWAWRSQRAWLAGALIGCAAMVKPFAALLVLPLAVAAWQRAGGFRGLRESALVSASALAAATASYVPFWSGDALVRNILDNPASRIYMNTLWEFASIEVSSLARVPRTWLEADILDPMRLVVLAGFIAAAAVTAVRTREFVPSAVVMWTGFCVAQAWLWPWYFLPIVALSTFSSGRVRPIVAAISAGGLVFYVAWPPPPKALGWMYEWRSVLLFGPALLVLAAHRLRQPEWNLRIFDTARALAANAFGGKAGVLRRGFGGSALLAERVSPPESPQ